MAAKGRRKGPRETSGRPSTFFIVAIVLALVLFVAAFVAFLVRTPGARQPEKKSSVVVFPVET